MKKYVYTALFFLTIVFNFSCIEVIDYPNEPEVSFKEVRISETTDQLGNTIYQVTLSIHLIDGNGDIGLNAEDTTGVFSSNSYYYNNLYISLFEKINGEFIKRDLIVPHRFRIPYIEPQGQNKTLIADVEVNLDYPVMVELADTIKYDFFIYDLALNQSNTAESPPIIFSEELAKQP